MNEDRDDEGKFSEKFPERAFLQAVESVETASTQNVADEVGCSYDLAYRRLKQFEEDGQVDSQKVGSAFIWRLIPE